MVMHEHAVVGRSERLTVNLLATHPTHLLNALRTAATPLPPQTRTEIERLIRRDHHFYENRRRR
jgi:hypothetical protein